MTEFPQNPKWDDLTRTFCEECGQWAHVIIKGDEYACYKSEYNNGWQHTLKHLGKLPLTYKGSVKELMRKYNIGDGCFSLRYGNSRSIMKNLNAQIIASYEGFKEFLTLYQGKRKIKGYYFTQYAGWRARELTDNEIIEYFKKIKNKGFKISIQDKEAFESYKEKVLLERL